MKRAGFTMIELIFVIVIIGILAAVALPKLVGVQESARQAKAGELVANLNSVVGPSLYAKAIANDGKIATYAGTTGITGTSKATWAYYMEVPTNFTEKTGGLTNCLAYNDAAAANNYILSDSVNSVYIFCRDGNATEAPRFWYSTKSQATPSTDFNISKSSF